MINIALLTNSITDRTLIFNLSYVLNEPINNIFLLAENHNFNEVFYNHENIYICNNIDEAINSSDIVVTINKKCADLFPKSKNVLFIQNPWIKNRFVVPEIESIKQSSNGKPIIAILSIGKFTDHYYIEILVNKILSENGANTLQFFSKETMCILSELSKFKVLNHNLLNTKEDADVIVVSIDGTKYHNDAEFICALSQLSPDILFLCIDRTFKKVTDIENITRIVREISLTIQSPYIAYETGTGIQYPVYCGYDENKLFINSSDSILNLYLYKQIIKNLYLPNDIVFC